MQALTDVGYTKNLSYMVKHLTGFSRLNYKLQTLNTNTATNGNIITVDLPSNSMVDLRTLTMFFNGSTTTTAGYANYSRNIESVIDRLEVEINGQLISTGANWLNHLYEALFDVTVGTDATNRRSLLQNAGAQVNPTANVTNQQYMIQNWLGFISSASPSICDTSLLGNLRLRISLTSPNALVQSAGCRFQLVKYFLYLRCCRYHRWYIP